MINSRVKLVPLDTIHDEYIVKWRNSPKAAEFLFSSSKVTLEDHRKWFHNYIQTDDREEFVIYINDTYIPIGTAGLSVIDKVNAKAEYGIIIGEIKYTGKGYAKEATKLILNYAFDDLQLNKVFLKVFEHNTVARTMYERLGFRMEGVLRQDVYKDGEFYNVVVMSILKVEWEINK